MVFHPISLLQIYDGLARHLVHEELIRCRINAKILIFAQTHIFTSRYLTIAWIEIEYSLLSRKYDSIAFWSEILGDTVRPFASIRHLNLE